MNIRKVIDTEPNQNPHQVDTRKLYDENLAQVVHIMLKPGEKLKRHITPVDVLFYVLEGTGIIEIGEEKMEATKDSLIESPAKIPHCWFNESESILRILVVKIPKPEEPTKLL
ncbi:MAG TPA: cupin domain-containing protein [Ignavibacteria bacterium]